jgi:hypothetical protein
MQLTDDIQDALDLWNADDTQWLLTDTVLYVICAEEDALRLLLNTRWEMTSPETLKRHLAQT